MAEINRLYKHYKGKIYKVLCFGKHSETGEEMIVYQNPENFEIWIRPENMWDDIVDNKGTKRFTLIEEE